MTDLKQKTEHFLALADAATPGPWVVHPFRAVVVPSTHVSRPLGCHEDPIIDRETYAQTICAMHWPDRKRNESEVRANANLVAAAPNMATHLRALQAENDCLWETVDRLQQQMADNKAAVYWKKEFDRAVAECAQARKTTNYWKAEHNAANAECEALRADAARYQWLRDVAPNLWYGDELIDAFTGDLDRAIDLAMNQDRSK